MGMPRPVCTVNRGSIVIIVYLKKKEACRGIPAGLNMYKFAKSSLTYYAVGQVKKT